jgi:VWFA-related protein
VTIILLDRLNTLIETSASGAEETPLWNAGQALQNAKQHVIRLVDELGPNDRVAIYSLGESLSVLSDFTSDRQELKTILNNFNATSITSREMAEPDPVHICPPGEPCEINGATNRDRQALADITNATRAQTTMAALSAIAAHVAAVPGRKGLVWLTANLPVSGEGVGRMLSRSNISIYPVDARGLLPLMAPRMTVGDGVTMLRTTNGGAVLGSGSTSSQEPPGVGAMQTLADETGGRASSTPTT